ncbi:SH2 domain-containing protein 5 [Protopterus annectens]|uniref:SH2 domain-containing protein 5 n=1 Tax=Protopterus annectens TaxID=7888 RepID=UPI001CFA897B|nr:SH2 domain-containing protein 5 [Protopterus annectens]XP_043919112.1 SH2 domain-containing protein 5 [Protopterus annectens]
MAHAIRRIYFTTCRPQNRQFAFVARNPQQPASELYCHLFAGSHPCEVKVLNLLLCRAFQMLYLSKNPEDREDVSQDQSTEKANGNGLVMDSIRSEDISQNINALVSFRRLPCQKDLDSSGNVKNSTERAYKSMYHHSSEDSTHCSPTLVRKKAIRNKVIRSGAFRCSNNVNPTSKCDERGESLYVQLSENEDLLMEAVYSFSGISRDARISVLARDVPGAFLLQDISAHQDHWSLTVRIPPEHVTYEIFRNEHGRYSRKGTAMDFPSMEALLDHYMCDKSGLLQQLDTARVNHCYEVHDCPESSESPRSYIPSTAVSDELSPLQEEGCQRELTSTE